MGVILLIRVLTLMVEAYRNGCGEKSGCVRHIYLHFAFGLGWVILYSNLLEYDVHGY